MFSINEDLCSDTAYIFANRNSAYIGSSLLGLKQIVAGSPGLEAKLFMRST